MLKNSSTCDCFTLRVEAVQFILNELNVKRIVLIVPGETYICSSRPVTFCTFVIYTIYIF